MRGNVYSVERIRAEQLQSAEARRARMPFDRFCRLACTALAAPRAFIALIHADSEQWLGDHGFSTDPDAFKEIAFAASLSRLCLLEGQPFSSCDTARLTGPAEQLALGMLNARAYAAVPLPEPDSGMLCVIDDRPRAFGEREHELLRELADAIGAQLALSKTCSQLAGENRLHEAILHNIPGAAVLLFDADLRYRVAEGPELYKTAGVPRSDLVGRSMLEVTAGENRVSAEQLYRATLLGRGGRMEMRRQNNWYTVHTSPVRDESGAVTHGLVTAYNVTELKAAQAALTEQTIILQSILDNMSEGIIVCDTQGNPIQFNPAGEHILGLGTDPTDDSIQEPGLFLSDRVTRLRPEQVPLQRAIAGDRVEQMELFDVAAQRWYSVSANPLVGQNGERRGGICVVRDVTRSKEADLALREQTAFVELLQKITLSANSAKSSSDTMRECLALVCTHMRWPLGHVFLLDAAKRELGPTDMWYVDDLVLRRPLREATAATRLPSGCGLPGRVLETRKAEWLEDMCQATDDVRARASLESGVRGSVAFPVLVASEVVAVLEFFSNELGHPHERLLGIMENVGVQLGRAVERERHVAAIEALSLTDELTKLCNRRGFMEFARRQLKVLRRQRRPALLFFADLDGLKQINDGLGHEMGDAAIVAAAEVLRQSFRDTDVIARFGGDEFIILVPEADPIVSSRLIERVEANLKRRNANSKSSFTIAMSIGFSVYDPDGPLPIEELLATADAAMYRQKQQRKLDGLGNSVLVTDHANSDGSKV